MKNGAASRLKAMFGQSRAHTHRPALALLRDDVIWAMGSFCALNRKPFDAELLLKQFPPPYTSDSLIHAARALGFRIKRHDYSSSEVAKLNLPCMVLLNEAENAAQPTETQQTQAAAPQAAPPAA